MKKKDDSIPPLPDNRGRHTWWHDILGNRRDMVIEDEIRHVPSNNSRKVICLQKMVFPKENRGELRLCYYMIGVKGRTKGKWVFGQFATLLPSKDFRALFTAANAGAGFRQKKEVTRRAPWTHHLHGHRSFTSYFFTSKG